MLADSSKKRDSRLSAPNYDGTVSFERLKILPTLTFWYPSRLETLAWDLIIGSLWHGARFELSVTISRDFCHTNSSEMYSRSGLMSILF